MLRHPHVPKFGTSFRKNRVFLLSFLDMSSVFFEISTGYIKLAADYLVGVLAFGLMLRVLHLRELSCNLIIWEMNDINVDIVFMDDCWKFFFSPTPPIGRSRDKHPTVPVVTFFYSMTGLFFVHF